MVGRILKFPLVVAVFLTFATSLPSFAAEISEKSAERLLVVAPKQFLPALHKFLQHKLKLLDTTLKPLDEILAVGTGADDAEKLKRFLYEQWKTRGLDYVLLVGDIDVLPVRYMTLDRVHQPAFNYSMYPCDLYYSDLAKKDGTFDDWNGRHDGFHAGYFGEVRGEANKDDPINYDAIDYQPDVAVGRWPVSTPDEAARIADKTIRYEQQVLSGKRPGLHRAGFVSVGGWVDSRGWMDEQIKQLGAGWNAEKLYYSNSPNRSAVENPTREQVCELFNHGTGLIVHAGHGLDDKWEECFFMQDLDRIKNADALPVVVSAGCSTATFAPLPPYGAYVDVNGAPHSGTDHGEKFDSPPPSPANYQTGDYNLTGLGEQILKRNENGAVAYIGCNTGSQPCGLTLVEGFVRAVANDEHPRLGTCWSQAVGYYYRAQQLGTIKPTESWYPASIFFQPMKFMLFGDPSLRLPTSRTEVR
ncbi:MAG: hypothetical protein IT427_02275 [Pirellulales bacterium]|nr:hypothetical protein [Pirellulales bacterium]